MSCPQPQIRMSASPRPFEAARVDYLCPYGLTIAEMLRMHNVGGYGETIVFINDEIVPPALWARIKPKPAALLTVSVTMGKGGGKSPLRAVLGILVAIAVPFAAPGLAAATGLSLGLAKGALGLVGSLLVNAIAPPSTPKLNDRSAIGSSRDSPTLFIEGARNDLRPFGVVPQVLGRHRFMPPQGAKPFTETIGDQQYVRQVFNWGLGPLDLDHLQASLKIGDTPISEFADVEIEVSYNPGAAPVLTLYPGRVNQTDLSVKLDQADGYQLRTTAPNADEILVDITFPNGLARFDAEGKKRAYTVACEFQYSPAGAGTWTTFATKEFTRALTSAVRETVRTVVPRGQYDVRVRRTTADTDSTQVLDETFWTALRTVTNENPILDKGVVAMAIRMRATDQLNGSIDTLSGEGIVICPDWDVETQTWITRATANPASIFRHVLQGPANARPLSDARVGLVALQDWHEYSASRGYEFNAVIDYETTVRSVLSDVAAAGRASTNLIDGKWGVVVDRVKTLPAQHFTPRNSWGYEGFKAFPDEAHAFRVQFLNRDKDYRQDERIVYADGYTAENATKFETLELFGITSSDQVYKHAREHLATVLLRPETHSFYCDIENLVATRGDLIKFAHDVPLFGLAQGRVKRFPFQDINAVTSEGEIVTSEGVIVTAGDSDVGVVYDAVTSEGETVTSEGAVVTAGEIEGEEEEGGGYGEFVEVDELCPMEAGKSYSVRFRLSDGSTLLRELVTEPGDRTILRLKSPIAEEFAPKPGDLFMFGESERESVDLVIRSIEPGPNESARLVCVDAAPAIFSASTGVIPAFDSQITAPPDFSRPAAPIIKTVQTGEDVLVRNLDGSVSSRMVITLENVNAGLVEPIVRIRLVGENAYRAADVVFASAEKIVLENFDEGALYDLEVYYRRPGVSLSGSVMSAPARERIVFEGASALPQDVQNFRLSVAGSVALLSWDPVTNVDFDRYEIRFSPEISGVTWAGSQLLYENVRETTRATPLLRGTYLIKARDRSGYYSDEAALVVSTAAEIAGLNVVETFTESPDFEGSHDNTAVDTDQLVLDDLSLPGVYGFADTLDLGDVYECTLRTRVVARGKNLSNTLSSWGPLRTVAALSGNVASNDWGVRVECRTTNDDPGGSPVWSEWADVPSGLRTFRAAEFRVVLNSYADNVTPALSVLEVTIDMPDRTVSIKDQAIAISGTRIDFDPEFRAVRAILITAQSLQSGDRWEKTNEDETGFDLEFFDATNASVARTVDITAIGYGRRQAP